MHDDKLKPCPFCGSTDVEVVTVPCCWSQVMCNSCKSFGASVSVSGSYASENKAIEAWNRRAKLEQDGKELAAVDGDKINKQLLKLIDKLDAIMEE